jgi:hypothetical protein
VLRYVGTTRCAWKLFLFAFPQDYGILVRGREGVALVENDPGETASITVDIR